MAVTGDSPEKHRGGIIGHRYGVAWSEKHGINE
jgi:hypothetical protein